MPWWYEILRTAAGGGGAVIVFAFFVWLFAGKWWKWFGPVLADQIAAATRSHYDAALEQLRGRIGASIYRSKAQFDAEFAVLQRIWAELSETRRRFIGARKGKLYVTGDKTKKDADDLLRAAAFFDAVNRLKPAIHDNGPFYPQEIFDSLQEFVDLCVREQSDLRKAPELRDVAWWTRADVNVEELKRLADEVATRIRTHLRHVVIVQ